MSTLLTSLGILLPESVLHSRPVALLAAFVALNTVLYVALSIAKALPKLYVDDYRPRRYERGETRSIFPDGPR